MIRSNRPRSPGDVFNIGDRVKCMNTRSKHYAHTACIIGMGRTRLHVEFENGHIGKFIDWRDAELIVPHITTPVMTTATSGTSSPSSNHIENDGDIEQLVHLLDHMAFTAATIISSEHEDSARMTRLLDSFDRAVREHANNIAGNRNRNVQHASPTRNSTSEQPPP
jgi:hypothetical protein